MSAHHTTARVVTPQQANTHEPATRYAHLSDRALAAAMAAEDRDEELGLDPLERITCRTHDRWLHQCVSSPQHVIVVTGHRWCHDCRCAVDIAIDEYSGDVRLRCTRCGTCQDSRAARQLVRVCRASIAAAAAGRRASAGLLDECTDGVTDERSGVRSPR